MFGEDKNSNSGCVIALAGVFVAVLIWCFNLILLIVRTLVKGISGVFKKEQLKHHYSDLLSLQQRLNQERDRNQEMSARTKRALEQVKDNPGFIAELKKQRDYCESVGKDLESYSKDLSLDIDRVDENNHLLLRKKYERLVVFLNGIHYAVDQETLEGQIKNSGGWNRFVTELLSFAGVDFTQKDEREWIYRKDGMKCRLALDPKQNRLHIRASSIAPLKSVERKNTAVDSDAFLYFDQEGELVVNHTIPLEEADHYDITEYFEYISHLLMKREINEYAGKNKILSMHEASDLECNVVEVLEKCKKVAPPPADYLPDPMKMYGGKERWAQLQDIQKSGMTSRKGFIIGKLGYGSYLYTGEYGSHILTIASTGSGKGVGVVVPNLLRHVGSMVVLDPKGENYMITARQRAENGNHVFYFDPWDIIGEYGRRNKGKLYQGGIRAVINPLDMIGEHDPDLIDKANMIASSLIVRESEKDTYFYDGAELLLTRMIVYLVTRYKRGENMRNMMGLRKILMFDKNFLLATLDKYQSEHAIHPVVEEFITWLEDIIATKNRGANDIYHFAQNATSFMMSEQVQEALHHSNVDVGRMKEGNLSLYLVLDLNKLTFNANYYKPLIRLIVTTCMMGVAANGQPRHKILFMLDEIAQLGTLQYLPNLLTAYRGKGVVVWTIWQNLSQLKKLYEEDWETIIGNCDVKQFFGVNDKTTAEYVSELAGMTTIYEESYSTNETHSRNDTDTETRGEQYSSGETDTDGNSSGYSYQGFNYTSSGGRSSSRSKTNTYTDSYNFSRSIQLGYSETKGKNLTKKTVKLITPFEVTTGNAYAVQFVFYMSKCPYPILSGKIRYFEEQEFYGEYGENLTR